GGRLAVRAADADAVLGAHELAEHLGAADERDAAALGLARLGVLRRPDGGRVDDDVGVGDVLGGVALVDRRAELLEAIGDGAEREVGAADAVAAREEHLGDARHPDPADADHVDVLDAPERRLPAHAFGHGILRVLARASTAWAI